MCLLAARQGFHDIGAILLYGRDGNPVANLETVDFQVLRQDIYLPVAESYLVHNLAVTRQPAGPSRRCIGDGNGKFPRPV